MIILLVIVVIIAAGVMLGTGGHRQLNRLLDVRHRDPAKQDAKEAFERKARVLALIVFFGALIYYLGR
jgi:hypothetical protein